MIGNRIENGKENGRTNEENENQYEFMGNYLQHDHSNIKKINLHKYGNMIIIIRGEMLAKKYYKLEWDYNHLSDLYAIFCR